MRKFFLSSSLFLLGLALVGVPARTQPILTASQSRQQAQQSTKSAAGTVASIGDDGRSFALEVNQGDNKQTLMFILDKDTQVEAQVKVGTAVTVEYVTMADQNLAKIITAQG